MDKNIDSSSKMDDSLRPNIARNSQYPSWWTDQHTSSWDRTKMALQRDWEQTKADLSKSKGQELNQGVGDTVKQALGKETIPAAGQPNVSTERKDWDLAEPAVRYGYGARQHFAQHSSWGQELESTLRKDWENLKSGRTWDEVKDFVRRGWNSATNKP